MSTSASVSLLSAVLMASSFTSLRSHASTTIEPLTLETLTRPVAVSGYDCSNLSVSSCFVTRADVSLIAGEILRFVGTVPLDEKSSPANNIEYNQLINASPNLCFWEVLVPYL